MDFIQSFLDLFRSRYVRYLEGEVVRLRQENAGLNSTLLASKGITVTASPDLQDLAARGRGLRQKTAPDHKMRAVVSRSSHATWKQKLESKSQQDAFEIEQEIAKRKEAREAASAT